MRQVLQSLPLDSLATLRLVTELLSKVSYSQTSIFDRVKRAVQFFAHCSRVFRIKYIITMSCVSRWVMHTLHVERADD